MDSAFHLQQVLQTQIPLSKQMGIVVAVSNAELVRFRLPLEPNHNHKMTAFGGTLIAAQALACWALLMELLSHRRIDAEVVLQREHSNFFKPVEADFIVETRPLIESETERFLQTLKLHHKARIEVSAQVVCAGEVACEFTGQYVAIMKSGRT